MPRVLVVSVGGVREVEWRGKLVRTGIWKTPVGDRPVRVETINLAGDDQGDRTVHGGADKAVYAYAAEDYRAWEGELGSTPEPGTFGENLTTIGIDLGRALIGERWRVGTAVLEVTQPRFPCYKLGIRMGDAEFPARFARSLRLGAYLRVLHAGDVRAGDEIAVLSRPGHDWSIGEVARIGVFERERLCELLELETLGSHMMEAVRRRCAGRGGAGRVASG
ncbi:MAG TPA: MOSC domain-containing protein [Gemmatimonadaceae bacterium]